ncbi:pentatricopeptide repeat protein [Xylona heveae TC161]|uniref:Pentatricopeptide repeat protein n=1 Tax=Xylona heveae (strain CBS 132557 / TC161) TaxID=1328760 RepID=A0A165HBD0_XYLHT|nr:pentatricopeptide repeat protein [Xylona heveae TC161]KZF23251.1 pentatricopeptide repeat protein [Xylona heveae TC161]
MVFKPFTHLTRQSIVKSFTHGYAQSVVAASQSSYASSTTSFGAFGTAHGPGRLGKNHSQIANALPHSPSSSGAATSSKSSHAGSREYEKGLAAYHAAWVQAHPAEAEEEWRHFQLVKRRAARGPADATEEAALESAEPRKSRKERKSVERSYSTSAVDELKQADAAGELPIDPAALAQEVEEVSKLIAAADSEAINPSVAAQPEAAVEQSRTQSPVSSDVHSSSISPSTSQTSFSDSPSLAYAEHVATLARNHRYAEIPAVFEAMLVAGILPTAPAYNALLLAAIHLPKPKHQVVPKVLEVYADMLRRSVAPSTETYTILIDLLASRTLEVAGLQQDLVEKRSRFGGMEEAGKFMFHSHQAEFDILAEDHSLGVAIRLFDAATASRKTRMFAPETYRLLLSACAEHGRIEDMIRIYSHLESAKVIPHTTVFSSMIKGFASTGDLSSAVECYNEYKALAIANDNGAASLIDRDDNEVYAALIKAYAACDRAVGGLRFFDKIVDSFAPVKDVREAQLASLHDAVVLKALVRERLERHAYSEAMNLVEKYPLSSSARARALADVCVNAADNNDVAMASKVFAQLSLNETGSPLPAMAMLALNVRRGDVESARFYWSTLLSYAHITPAFIEPTAMYAVALIGSGHIDEGLSQARQMFSRARASVGTPQAKAELVDEIDEAIEFIGRFLSEKRIVPPVNASMSLLWAMVENGGLVTSVADQALTSFTAEGIAQLSWKDLTLLLQVQSGMLMGPMADIAAASRFAQLLDVTMSSGMPIDKRTAQLIEQALSFIAKDRPDLLHRFREYLVPRSALAPLSNPKVSSRFSASPHEDAFDPHAASTDFKGSVAIAETLEKGHGSVSARLEETLNRVKSMRRAGRHPRYVTYAKLISAAARDNRVQTMHEVLAMARHDVPLLTEYRVVRYGWVSILDAMVAGSLVLGDRAAAAKYHQELLDMGATPTANTFGLYITTLKDTAKTFDEATEAVNIFLRAKSEGVEPSSFLYNALIGKLGKARRIDDCLFYFSEMRALGIRPTSVTYGTIVNALCRVSDEKLAEELFEEMEITPNYQPRPAPYNSMMQFFLTTKRDRTKVMAYFERMKSKNIRPTLHTYKLLVDSYATLEPVDMTAAEAVIEEMRRNGVAPEAVHFASLIHAKGCVLHDMAGARAVFEQVIADGRVRLQACLYQALFEAMVANHCVVDTEALLNDMHARNVEMTPYIANTLIHGWALEKNLSRSEDIYNSLGSAKREPSTYEAMIRAYLSIEDRAKAQVTAQEMLSRGYPAAVSAKITDLVSGGTGSTSEAMAQL